MNTEPDPSPIRTQTILPTALSPTEIPQPTIEPTMMASCNQVTGSLEATQYPGVVGSEEVSVLIHLPPCYEDNQNGYPVLYLLHGYPLDENHWLELGIVDFVNTGYTDGQLPHFLIVLPFIPPGLNVSTDGGVGSYEQEFIEGLVGFVESNYRVEKGAGSTAIAGVSRGGVWSLEIGFNNTDRIGIVAALSPALHVNNPRPAYDPFSLIRDPANRPNHLFVSIGVDEEGFYQKIVEFAHLLEQLGIEFTYLETPGRHENNTWIGIMGDLVEFITATW
jgi:enterochelin esterase-like enzyme